MLVHLVLAKIQQPSDYAFASMRQLFEALWYGFKKSSPIVTLDSS
jgi:hypothetical protein